MHDEGIFLTLEGGDGSGKSTLIDYLKKEWGKKKEIIVTREPGGTPLGEKIRHWLLQEKAFGKVANQTELLLFLAARAQHIAEVIQPGLDQKKVVLCDRFSDSTIAYQGAGRGYPLKELTSWCHLVDKHCIPHLTFLLDIDPQIGLKRIQQKKEDFDRIESEAFDFHERVRMAYLELAKQHPKRICLIDASLPKEKMIEAVKEALQTRLGIYL